MLAVSNVLGGFLHNIPVRGTCAHAYIMSYQHIKDHGDYKIQDMDMLSQCFKVRNDIGWNTNLNELISFVSFCSVYKKSSLLLVDTYNTIESGVKNAIILAIVLDKQGYSLSGIRLDSGDLAELSKYINTNNRKSRELFDVSSKTYNIEAISNIKVSASNDINERSIKGFNQNGHSLDILGIGTNLVTCQLQPFVEIVSRVVDKPNINTNILLYDGKCVETYLNELKTAKDRLVKNLENPPIPLSMEIN
jgi:nicotinate phosphoribosyltransferase